tara:strand:+ start:37 stop:201 length:165 start_codon:yes stop_codon:yes gene_type:complete
MVVMKRRFVIAVMEENLKRVADVQDLEEIDAQTVKDEERLNVTTVMVEEKLIVV